MSLNCTKLPEPLSAKVKNSFAYKTLTFRLPVIITKVIDLLCRQRKQIPKKMEMPMEEMSNAEEETKHLIEELAKLKYELQTNKHIKPIISELSDTDAWNDYLKQELKHNQDVVYFNVSWLYSECYFYRMMREIFIKSKYFKNYDYFSSIKEESFKQCLKIASNLSFNLITIANNKPSQIESVFHFYIMTSLWGNKFDLSLSCGESNINSNFDFKGLESKILVNDLNNLWSYVKKFNDKPKYRIDLVLDNAGYELFTDLCLIEALHSIDIIPKDKGKVHFYVKKMPWFVSDTMSSDIIWLLKFISEHIEISQELKEVNNRFKENFVKRLWVLEEYDFWTLPHDFARMPTVSPELYRNLCKSDLILFKGDLNYRKLVGDLKWNFNTPFKHALREFQPTSAICSLRTIKADVVVGIHDEKILERIKEFPSDWMETGEYAVINFLEIKN